MKKLYSLLFLVILLSTKIVAQNTCSTPYPINSSTYYSYLNVTGTPNLDLTNNYGCVAPANNASWFYFQACSSGTVDIMFNTFSGSSTADIDFIVWGPLSAPTDCGLTAGQILDCTASLLTYDTLSFPVISGSYYKILATNTSNNAGTFDFQALSSVLFDSICTSCTGAPPLNSQGICEVTTDPILNKNIIIWEKDTMYTGSYVIEKETTTMGVYAPLATILNNDTSAYMDPVSNPMIQAFKYRIQTTDSCSASIVNGYESQTIHLLTSISSSTGYPQLNWSNYYGFPYYTYFIYRGASPSTLTLYDSISASFNTYTDVAAVPGLNFYSVSVNPPSPCQPSRSMTMGSFSNVSPVMFTGINEYEFNQLTVGPNPAYDVLNFTLGNVSADISIDIIDITGRIIYSKTFENVNQDVISLSEISNGSYVVRFTSENKTTHRNIIIAR